MAYVQCMYSRGNQVPGRMVQRGVMPNYPSPSNPPQGYPSPGSYPPQGYPSPGSYPPPGYPAPRTPASGG